MYKKNQEQSKLTINIPSTQLDMKRIYLALTKYDT